MNVKYSSFLGILVALVLVASFVVPARLMSPESVSAAAEQSKMQWWPVDTPDTEANQTKSLYSPIIGGTEAGSELVKLTVGSNGTMMWAVYSMQVAVATHSKVRLTMSPNGGRSWTGGPYAALIRDIGNYAPPTSPIIVWDIAQAPDNPALVIAAISSTANIDSQQVWISEDGGSNWQNTQWPPTGYGGAQGPVLGADFISALDISMDYGARSILVGVRGNTTANTANKLWTMKMPGYGGWNVQNTTNGSPASTSPFGGDIIDAKFSPTFNGDSTIAVLYSGVHTLAVGTGTFLVTGVHDIAKNSTTWQAAGTHVEIKKQESNPGMSLDINEIITGMIQMPSDFSGQSASLRRFYICTDGIG